MSRKRTESRPPRKAAKIPHGGVNGYMHVAKPATASRILCDLGISQAQAKRLVQGLKFVSAGS